MSRRHDPLSSLSPLEFHVLLVLADEPLYGYAILKAVTLESSGRLAPDVGTLYRVLARLERDGLVGADTTPQGDAAVATPSPGRPRRYYRITDAGRASARAEAERMRRAVEIAAARNLLPELGEVG